MASRSSSSDDGDATTISPLRTRGQRRVTVELWIILGLLALGAVARWVDSPAPRQLPALQVFGSALSPAVVLAVMAAWSRRWPLAAAASAFALMQLALIVPWSLPGDRTQHGDDVDPLVVMASNLHIGKAEVDAVISAVDDHEVDVLMLSEATPGALRGLRAAGVGDRLPHALTRPREDAAGALIFSRYPLRHGTVPPAPRTFFNSPATRVIAPTGDVIVLSVHPVPPWPGHTALWYAELEALASWADGVPGGTPLVVAGDFNATTAHPVFRRFAELGLRDAHREVGGGPVTTWPRMTIPVVGVTLPGWFHIDHVLARGMNFGDAGVVRIPGSDHDAVWAELVPPDG